MTEPAVMMWFDGDEKDLEALIGIFGPQPQVLGVIRPDGTVRYRGWARLWPESYFERPRPPVDWEDTVAKLALAHGWGEVGLMRECQQRGLDFARALKIYRTLEKENPRGPPPSGAERKEG